MDNNQFLTDWGLTLMVFLPLAGALVMLLIPKANEVAHKLVALAASLAAAVIKVAMVFRAAGLSLVDGKFAFVVIQLGVLFAVPGIFSIVAQPRDQKLQARRLPVIGDDPVPLPQQVGKRRIRGQASRDLPRLLHRPERVAAGLP